LYRKFFIVFIYAISKSPGVRPACLATPASFAAQASGLAGKRAGG